MGFIISFVLRNKKEKSRGEGDVKSQQVDIRAFDVSVEAARHQLSLLGVCQPGLHLAGRGCLAGLEQRPGPGRRGGGL